MKDSWLQTNLPRRFSTDAEVNPTYSLRDQTFGSVQHYGRNKKRMVDSKTKIESEENGQHVQRLQGFQHETLWGYSNSRHATVPLGSKQTLLDNRSRFCRTYRFQDGKEGAGKVLHFAVYLRYVEGDTFRIDEDPDRGRISEKVKLVHSQENKAQGHDIS